MGKRSKEKQMIDLGFMLDCVKRKIHAVFLFTSSDSVFYSFVMRREKELENLSGCSISIYVNKEIDNDEDYQALMADKYDKYLTKIPGVLFQFIGDNTEPFFISFMYHQKDDVAVIRALRIIFSALKRKNSRRALTIAKMKLWWIYIVENEKNNVIISILCYIICTVLAMFFKKVFNISF